MTNVWPSSDFSDWPDTRISALLFNLVLTMIFASYVARMRFCRNQFLVRHRDALVKHLYYLHIWPRGLFGISQDDSGSIHVMQVSLCGCRKDFELDSRKLKSVTISSRRNHDVAYAIVFGAIVNSCLVGLYAHFVPCLWWTCDWGDHDGEGVRGAIWFTLWALLGVISIVSSCVSSPSHVLTLIMKNDTTRQLYLDNLSITNRVREMLNINVHC